MAKEKQKYVIGIDGGATKTIAALADLNANILGIVKTGSSNPRNIGVQSAVENIVLGINKILKKKADIVSVFIGLPAVQEEYKTKIQDIEKEIIRRIPKTLSNKVRVGSDQAVAFRSGTDEKSGVMIIAGTGCVAHGWRGGREAKASGWGWLADEGSAVWVGRQVFEAVLKDIDDRGSKTDLTKLVLEKLKALTAEKLTQKIYKENFLEIISSFSVVADIAAKKGDNIARKILRQAGEEAALAADTVIKKLDLKKQSFPLVLVGSMFLSESFKKSFEFYIKQASFKAKIIYPENLPVLGAVKLAIDNVK